MNCNRKEDCRVVKYLQLFGTTINQAQGSLTHSESPCLASQLSLVKFIVYAHK